MISQSICDIMKLENQIIKNVRYSSYCYDYNIITVNIPVDLNLGKKIKDSADPERRLNQFLNRDNICSFFTDGSKVDKNAAVGSSVYCSLLSLEQKFT